VRYDWVGGDCIYGNSFMVRRHLYDKKQAFVLDVGEELGVYLEKPEIYLPAKKEGRGRTPTTFVSDTKAVLLKNLIKEIAPEDWQTIKHRQGTKGDLIRKAVMIDVHIWKPERGTEIESGQLIISTETDGSEVKYSLCYNKEGKMALAHSPFSPNATLLDRKSLSKCQRTIRVTSISGTVMECVAPSYCLNLDGSAFYLRDSN
jgi:hypothetical protein